MEQILFKLLSMTEGKLAEMQSLLGWNQQQAALLQSENVDALHDLLDQKQQVMDRVDGLDQRTRALLVNLEETHGVVDLHELTNSSAAARILELSEVINAAAQSAMSIDQQNAQLSQQLLAKLQQQMQSLVTSSNASKVYAQAGLDGNPLSVFMNRKL